MRALPLSVVHSDDLAEAFWHPGTADLSAGRGSPVSNFIQTPHSHRPRLLPRVVFPYGRELRLSGKSGNYGSALTHDRVGPQID
jgi:hypothetical protein